MMHLNIILFWSRHGCISLCQIYLSFIINKCLNYVVFVIIFYNQKNIIMSSVSVSSDCVV